MLSSSSLLTLLLPASAAALHIPRASTPLQWSNCTFAENKLGDRVRCANLTVPLDYTDPSRNETLTLNLIKYPAEKQPAQGNIILNFGGPGEDGLVSMTNYGPLQGNMTGNAFDLISWDPRGTGNTLPFACWPGEEGVFGQLGSGAGNASDAAVGQLWAEGAKIADKCNKTLGEKHLGLVGMAFAARDLMQIVDAVEDDGMLRYWGISGGTILGATAAALFPDRMDKVILDGVANSHEFYRSSETQLYAGSDAVYQAFLNLCIQDRPNCPLASNHTTAASLDAQLQGLLEDVKYHPRYTNGTIVDYSLLKTFIFMSLYTPVLWKSDAAALASLITGDVDAFVTTANRGVDGGLARPKQQAVLGIRCGDKLASGFEADYDDFVEMYNRNLKMSTLWGDGAAGTLIAACAHWKAPAKEVYKGDFKVKTKNPVLWLGSPYDPVTPLASAVNMSSGFDGSVVVQHNGLGHCSLTHRSKCTDGIIFGYFANGTLPANGTICEPNFPRVFNASAQELMG